MWHLDVLISNHLHGVTVSFPKTQRSRQLTKGEKGSGEQCCWEGLRQIQDSEVGKGDQPWTQESTELWKEDRSAQATSWLGILMSKVEDPDKTLKSRGACKGSVIEITWSSGHVCPSELWHKYWHEISDIYRKEQGCQSQPAVSDHFIRKSQPHRLRLKSTWAQGLLTQKYFTNISV